MPIDKPVWLKPLLHGVGGLLSLLAIVFVVLQWHAYRDTIDFTDIAVQHWLLLAVLAAAYGAAGLLLATGWHCILGHLGLKVRRMWSWRVYAISQLIKYVPGNVFHLAGRQAMGMAAGLPGGLLAKSAILDLLLPAVLALIFAPVACLYFDLSGWLAASLSIGIAILLLSAFRHYGSNSLLKAACWYLLFLVCSGLLFALLAVEFSGHFSLQQGQLLVTVAAAYIVAWLAGMLTPGAPAGIGVREVVLYALLQQWSSQADILQLVITGRIMTLGGDLLLFIVAHAIRTKSAL